MSEAIAISPELKNNRVETLNNLLVNSKKIVVTNLMGYLRYLPNKNEYKQTIINLSTNQEINQEKLIEDLNRMGYERNTIVEKTGDMAIRGFVIDVFPPSTINPIRIELWGDNIESIREFDLDTQLTIKKRDKIKIEPCNELLENNKTGNLLNFFETEPLIFLNEYSQIEENYKQLQNEMVEYSENTNNVGKKYMNDFKLYGNEIYLSQFDNYNNVQDTINYESYDLEPFSNNLNDISNRLNKYLIDKKTVIVCLNNKYQINKILDNIDNANLIMTNEQEIFNKKINLIIKNIENGFIYDDYVVISESEIFNKKINKIRYKNNF